MSNWLSVCFFLIFTSATVWTFMYIQNVQPKPYMDEIFHIPQAQQYCHGNFTEWDPMITTLPGLYVSSVGLLKPVSLVLNTDLGIFCTSDWLRSINILFTLGNFYLLYAIIQKLHNPVLDPDGVKLSMTTLALSQFPVLYFFTFLYYTDPGSTFFVLFMYLFGLYESHMISAILGAVSVLFRQTNIAWVVFMAGLTVRRQVFLWMRAEKKEFDPEKSSSYSILEKTIKTFLHCIKHKRKSLSKLFQNVILDTWCYIIVGLGFCVFIFVNKGIVVGDRSHHTACYNFPQIFYFLCVVNFFACFHTVSPAKVLHFLRLCLKYPKYVAIFVAVSAIVIQNFTYEHEYLLADNRHYTFYVWSKIYRQHALVKYALIPVYMYGMWSFFDALQYREIFWKIIYVTCVLITTVPQKLLEFRYFVLPYLIFRVNMRYGTAFALLHEILISLLVNVVTVYMFTQKPFKWDNSDELMRFMW